MHGVTKYTYIDNNDDNVIPLIGVMKLLKNLREYAHLCYNSKKHTKY